MITFPVWYKAENLNANHHSPPCGEDSARVTGRLP